MGAEGARLRRRLCRRVVEGERVQKVQRVQRVMDCRFAAISFIMPPKAADVTVLAFVSSLLPRHSSGGRRRYESQLHGVSKREPRNLSAESCLSAVTPAWSIMPTCCLVHPFPLRGTSPQGEARRYVLSFPSYSSFWVGQPTIGKPFYVQSKGQLRLTWRPYAGPPHSEESRSLPILTRTSTLAH